MFTTLARVSILIPRFVVELSHIRKTYFDDNEETFVSALKGEPVASRDHQLKVIQLMLAASGRTLYWGDFLATRRF